MEISRPGAKPPSPEELQELETLKKMVERAMADGILSQAEMADLKAFITGNAAEKAPEQIWREIQLYRNLVAEKVKSGELRTETLGN